MNMAVYSKGTENKLKICRLNCLGVRIASPLPRDNGLSHFLVTLKTVMQSAGCQSPKKIETPDRWFESDPERLGTSKNHHRMKTL